jgi:ABC-type nitrate/sulfonate/bicarbonate transport system substrate-binding protein
LFGNWSATDFSALRAAEENMSRLAKACSFFYRSLLVFILLGLGLSQAEAAPVKITIGHGAMSTSTVPLWVTKEQGFFAKHGIEAGLVAFFRGAPTVIASLVSGEIQICYLGASSVIGAASQGIELKITSSLFDRLTHDLIAMPSIKRAEDLRGKRFGIQSFGGGGVDSDHAGVGTPEARAQTRQNQSACGR